MDIPPLPEGADDEDWFGDGTAFNSQAELASALLNVDGSAPPPAMPMPEPEPEVALQESEAAAEEPEATSPEFETAPEKTSPNGQANGHGDAGHADGQFELVDPRNPDRAFEPEPAPPPPPPPRALPTWSVRIPGVQLLPARQPGRTGWSMDNSVRILRQTEELVFRLREEAVIAAFAAAARALRGEDR